MTNSLDDSIQFLKHVGPARADDFAKLDVNTVRDLIWTFPRDMSDRSSLHTIADSPEYRPVTIVATAVGVIERTARRRGRFAAGRRAPFSITTAEITDDSGGILEVVWFNQPWLKDKLAGARVLLHGKAKRVGKRLHMDHPLYEIVPDNAPASTLNFGRIVPIYPCTGSLNQALWRRVMAHALDTRLDGLEDPLDGEFLRSRDFPDRRWAVRTMHFPESPEDAARARRRLAWEECFYLQLAVLAARRHALHDLPGRAFKIGPELDTRIRRLFPFRLTGGQDRAARDIARDMQSPLPMQRLLQGDVGSGKTAVAAYALLAAVANRAQACIMAPTSLLARQHHETFSRFLTNSPNARVRVGVLTGGMAAAEKRLVLERLANGTLDIVAATHSAIGDNVVFHDLGLVIIDEQHKFGVRQRFELSRKGVRPDLLVMTATPIPRSLALSVYGDLDLSVIDELPPGRKPVKTLWISRGKPGEAWELMRRELSRGRQGFVVCPLVEESEDSDLRSAEEMHRELSAGELKGFRLEILHGRMKRPEQQAIMDRFREGRIDAIVSTIVIEVGVDVPNSTVMLVDHAERFGLAQLHQLRGRVGRGAEQGYFLMLSDARGGEAGERLSALLAASDGFAIAEADLRIRGPGDFTGTRQHGLSSLRLVDLASDIDLMADARSEAARILEDDPELTRREHVSLRRELTRLYGKQWDRVAGS
jgi:ATP-dependent DNA helicase RecG